MWFSADTNIFVSILEICNVIVFHYVYKYTIDKFWEKDTIVTYKFSQTQIHLVNLLASKTFPEDFFFGMEAPIANEKSYCIMHEKLACNNVEKCISLDSLYKYKEDIQLAKSIGVQMFKVSLSWARILPHGFASFVNQDAVRYYDDVINEIIANGMTPMVVLFDWDLPRNLQLLGGCANPLLVEWFQTYAEIVFGVFGDRVKFWVTINGANLMAHPDRGMRTTAINQSGIVDYLCGHYALLAHARVYDMYNENFRRTQNGKIGIAQFYVWMELQNNDSHVDIYGSRRGLRWYNSWLTHPIFSQRGDYPKLMRDRIDFKCLLQGFSRSRLPYFTDEEVRLVKGSADFLGINFYGEVKIRAVQPQWDGEVSFQHDADVAFISENEEACKVITSSALSKLLEWLNNEYTLPEIYITENSYADIGEIAYNREIVDINRIIYLRRQISQVVEAMRKGINIRSYLIWSLVDDFARGTYGLFHVDNNDSNHARIPTSSSRVISEIYKTKVIRSTLEQSEKATPEMD